MNPTSVNRTPTEQDRIDLVRALSAWTGNLVVAEDLAQQTLIEAWKSSRQPIDAEWRPWLFGIARNVLLRWRRDLARDLRRSIAAPANEAVLGAIAVERDIDADLEQREIVSLLHDVLDELPVETRQVLLLKYIHELPQAEIAAELGMHEKALEGRLHRGKRKLRTHLLQYKPDTALSLGLVTESGLWQPTEIWCTTCGQHRLQARWFDDGRLQMDCPSCSNGWFRNGERSQQVSGQVFKEYVPVRPTFKKAMTAMHQANDVAMKAGRNGAWPCPNCRGMVRPQAVPPRPGAFQGFDENTFDLCYACDSCYAVYLWRFLPASGIYTGAGRAFEQRNPRVRMVKPVDDERHGRPAVRSAWEAIDGSAEFLTWYDMETWRLLDAIASDENAS